MCCIVPYLFLCLWCDKKNNISINKKTNMKTRGIKMLIAVLAFTMTSAISVNAENFFFDKKEVNGKVVESMKYVIGDDGNYVKQLKNDFSYDADGRLTRKVTYRWDDKKEKWTPQSSIDREYNNRTGTMDVSYSTWNDRKKEFDVPTERVIYQLDKNGDFVSANFYKEGDKEGIHIFSAKKAEELVAAKELK